jgi:hypothetical protein
VGNKIGKRCQDPVLGIALAEPSPLGSRRQSCCAMLAHRWVGRPGLGVSAQHRAPLPHDVRGQLDLPPLWDSALRHSRRQPKQLVGGAAHSGRGLAQQPSPLPEFGQPGLPLVGDRRVLLLDKAIGFHGSGVGHPQTRRARAGGDCGNNEASIKRAPGSVSAVDSLGVISSSVREPKVPWPG